MRHLDDGTLRRFYDEPVTLSARAREHYDSCARCQNRFAAIAADARAAARLLQQTQIPSGPVPALAQFRQRLAEDTALQHTRRTTPMIPTTYRSTPRLPRFAKPLGGIAAVAAIVAGLALTPAGSFAQNLLTIFEPKNVTPIQVSAGDLHSLPDLSQYGTMSNVVTPTAQQVATAAEAQRATGLTVLAPGTLPSGVPTTATYLTTGRATGSFTFSAAKAAQAVQAAGHALPPMPAGLDGSTLQVAVGPAVVAVYGGNLNAIAPSSLKVARNPVAMARHAARYAARQDAGTSPDEVDIPHLVIGEMAAPHITSTGATVAAIENYLLAQPGISPQLAARIRAIQDPTATLPIPVPADRVTSHQVQVQGVSAVALGDNTGLGSAVIWEKDGIVYGVAGTLPEDQVLAVANSLH